MRKLADISMFERLQSNANAGFMSDLSVFNFTTPKLADISAFERLCNSANLLFIYNDGELDPDVELMLELQRGNRAAHDELVKRNTGLVLSFLHQMMGNKPVIPDLVQDVFTAVLESAGSYKPTASFPTWLYHITRNVVRNTYRREKRHPETSFSSLPSPQADEGEDKNSVESFIPDKGLNPSQAVEKQEQQDVVRKAVATLPERQRQALTARMYQDMSYKEIAEQMNTTVDGVKDLLIKAHKVLRTRLASYMRDGF